MPKSNSDIHVNANFPQNVLVKKIRKSVSIWHRYGQKLEADFVVCTHVSSMAAPSSGRCPFSNIPILPLRTPDDAVDLVETAPHYRSVSSDLHAEKLFIYLSQNRTRGILKTNNTRRTIRKTHIPRRNNHYTYKTRLVARNETKLYNSERMNVEPSEKSRTLKHYVCSTSDVTYVTPFEFLESLEHPDTRVLHGADSEDFVIACSLRRFDKTGECDGQTDRRTDGRTDGRTP